MAQKKITDLTLRSSVVASCNLATDDTVQTYRITMPQIFAYLWPLWFSSRTISAGSNPLTLDDRVVYLNPTAGSFSQDLLALDDVPDDFVIIFKNIATNGNTVTLDADGSELIDNAATLVLGSDPMMDSVTLIKHADKWLVI